jgi:putative cell wall-binding protein
MRRTAAVAGLLLLITALVPIETADAGALVQIIRYAGTNRYGTAAAIAEGDFPNPAAVDTVFVAVGDNFPDALAGAAIAGKLGAPLLLITSSGIPQQTRDELTRLDPDTIVVLGGTAVVSASVQTQLGAYAPTVIRLAGGNRYSTSVEISKYGFPANGSATEVVIATGTNFADALAGGPLAAVHNGPVLLTDPNSLPAVVASEISRLAPDRIVVLGGTAAVSDAVFTQLKALQNNTVRIAGPNRYSTSVEISQDGFPGGAPRVYIATGLNFPDALAGAAAAAAYGAPILLVPTADLVDAVYWEINRLGAGQVVILGGRSVVGTPVQAEVATLIGAAANVSFDLTFDPPQGMKNAISNRLTAHPDNVGLSMTVRGTATFAAAFDGHVGVVAASSYAGTDVFLTASDNGTTWRVAGTHLATLGETRQFGPATRFVTVIGGDYDATSRPDPLYSYADSVHIVSLVAAPAANPAVAAGAIVGIPRDTVVHVPYSHGDTVNYCTGTCDQLNHTMVDKGPGKPKGPATTVTALEMETGIAIEGYFHTGFGSNIDADDPGFTDLVDAFVTFHGLFNFVTPYSVGSIVTEGQETVDGDEALAFARERATRPRGDQDRSLAHGLLMKAALANVQPLGVTSTPGLLAIMDDFVTTDLSVDAVLTFAATLFSVDTGPMPTLTAADLVAFAEGAYDRNKGSLPNVVLSGCGIPQEWYGSFAFWLTTQNRATITDLQDGLLSSDPVPCLKFP